VPVELIQTLVNAALLLVVAFVGGTLGLRRFEAVERSVAELRADVRSDIAELRADLRADVAELRTELKADLAELRGEQAGMRSDLTVVALAVGARRAKG
jgi:ribosomal protein L29